ncbi:MAG: 50S ribosomal protein L19e [Promethearchaeota archaeon]
MNLNAQRRLAAKALKCGEKRVYLDPFMLDEIATAITMQDIRGLINSGIIRRRYPKGISRARAKAVHQQKKKGRRAGKGSRKGMATARNSPKKQWITRIRGMRAFLKNLRDKKHIDTAIYQKYYYLCKGGTFNSVKNLKKYMQAHGVLKKD